MAQDGLVAALGEPVPCVGTGRHSNPKLLLNPVAAATFVPPMKDSATTI